MKSNDELFGVKQKLRVAAECAFLQQRHRQAYHSFLKTGLPDEVEKAIKTCLLADVSEGVVYRIIDAAWKMALQRHEARKEVFVAASLTRARSTLPYVKFAIKFVRGQGYRVLSEHNGADHPLKTFLEQVGNPETYNHNLFRDTDNTWIKKCGLFIADLTDPSHGVGGEWENCRLKPELGSFLTPMLGISLADTKVSAYVDGIREEEKSFIWFRSYRDEDDLAGILSEFLEKFG